MPFSSGSPGKTDVDQWSYMSVTSGNTITDPDFNWSLTNLPQVLK